MQIESEQINTVVVRTIQGQFKRTQIPWLAKMRRFIQMYHIIQINTRQTSKHQNTIIYLRQTISDFTKKIQRVKN